MEQENLPDFPLLFYLDQSAGCSLRQASTTLTSTSSVCYSTPHCATARRRVGSGGAETVFFMERTVILSELKFSILLCNSQKLINFVAF